MATKPTIIALPGAWHGPEIYDATLSILKAKGYPTIPMALPSVGAIPPNSSYSEDLTAIRNQLKRLIEDQGKDVVLACHSYSGMPATDATQGLGKAEREKKGEKGGVARIVFVMGFAQLGGFHTDAEHPLPEWMSPDLEKGIITVSPANAKKTFYNDLSDAEADKWIKTLKHQSMGVYTSDCVYPAWRDIPCTYIKATQDKAMPLEMIAMWLDTARKLAPNAFDVVEECDSGHCPMLAKPEWLAGALERAAGEGC